MTLTDTPVPRLLAPLLLCLALGGCTQWDYTLGTPLAAPDIPGAGDRPTLGAVMERLGPPHRVSAADGGLVLAWEYWHVRENSLGFNLGPVGIDFLSIAVATVDTRGQFLLATFDRDHRLTATTFSEWDNRIGDGRAIQPFGVVDLVTTGDLVSGQTQHRWGAAMLRRLPETLNSESDLDDGASGLEQRGTPENIGQRALELR